MKLCLKYSRLFFSGHGVQASAWDARQLMRLLGQFETHCITSQHHYYVPPCRAAGCCFAFSTVCFRGSLQQERYVYCWLRRKMSLYAQSWNSIEQCGSLVSVREGALLFQCLSYKNICQLLQRCVKVRVIVWRKLKSGLGSSHFRSNCQAMCNQAIKQMHLCIKFHVASE